ncbi:hypothetical protein IFM89_022072 [Coptis chinensis]|uniref:Uncharacterized protein n=1 Tax=Coptis chinensis TaxID=261450 RepID=A0A835H865_9MAGN|nr:hypothetical protein IFM89_022072 [Coptis chinensis]
MDEYEQIDPIFVDNLNNEGDGDKDEFSSTPLKKYVKFLEVRKGGACKWICNFKCKKDPYTGTYSRIRAHLIGLLPGQKAQGVVLCSKVSKEERDKMKREEEEANKVHGGSKKHPILVTPIVPPVGNTSSSILGLFKVNARNDVTAMIALEVIQVKKTRFGSHYIMLERVVRVKKHLISLVLSDEWEKIKKGRSKNIKHEKVKKTILDDEFWEKAKLILSFTKPIWFMIRFCDSDKAVIGEVYQRMSDMLSEIKEALLDHWELSDIMEDLINFRWEKMNRPLHCLAYVLTPHYYSQAWLRGGPQRRKTHADPYVDQIYLNVVERMVSEPLERVVIRQQLSDYLSNKGTFARPQAIADRVTMLALAWWDMYGNDIEGVEEREHNLLYDACVASLGNINLSSQAEGSSSNAQEQGQREEIARGKRPREG